MVSLAKEQGIKVKTGKFIMSANGKSLITKEERGFIKIVADEETDVILGAQMMCARATDMIGEFVTAIANKAFKGDKKLKKVVIGKNVQTIGKSAFEKATNLKSITIKSTSLKKVGKKAFKGIHAKAKIKVPAKKLRSYKRLLKGKGQKAGVKITK